MENFAEEALERFRGALRIETVWPDSTDSDGKAVTAAQERLSAFQSYLVSAFPEFHAATERHAFGPFGVAYRWPAGRGSRADTPLPVLLIAHYDVVPAEAAHWSVPPFSAETVNGEVYARGALDTKNTLMACLEAANRLCAEGFAPARDVWFAFGGDEERSGLNGAKAMADWFQTRGIRFDWLLDEGGIVAKNGFPGVKESLALVGIEEKGFLDLVLTVKQEPGHSSRPPNTQAVAVLAKALVRVSRKPFPFSLIPSVEGFFRRLGELSSGPQGFALRHARQLGPLFFRIAGASPLVLSFFRTTCAMTQLFGSEADNILPSEASAVLNLRLLPGWDVARATEWVRKAVKDPRVEVAVNPRRSANDPVAAPGGAERGEGPGWEEMRTAIGTAFPHAVTVPYLVTATTDSRHYAPLCRGVYRFAPAELTAEEVGLIHGHDERISADNYLKGIAFYRALMGAL